MIEGHKTSTNNYRKAQGAHDHSSFFPNTLTQGLGPTKTSSCVGWHFIHRHLKVPGPLTHPVGCPHHGVALLPGHSQTVIRNL